MDKAKNRSAMPTTASIVDSFREFFPDLKVIYASENGKELGKKDTIQGLSLKYMIIEETKDEKPRF